MTTDYDSVDYFTDQSLVPDPHPYYDHIREKDPVCCPVNNGVLAATGWESANTVCPPCGYGPQSGLLYASPFGLINTPNWSY